MTQEKISFKTLMTDCRHLHHGHDGQHRSRRNPSSW